MPHLKPLAISLCLLLGGCSIDLSPSKVKVSEEPAGGLTESAFDQGYLQRLVEETRQAAEENLQRVYERNRTPAADRSNHARTAGRYERVGEHRLAVIDLSYSANPMRVMRVVGIVGDRRLTISCISPQGEPPQIHASSGECAETIAEYYGSSD